ncbi:MAG: MG2 domain-containing protein [Byssovorax sp.]
MAILNRLRLRLAPLVVVAMSTSMACLQGARAPTVEPRGTLAPDGAEAGLAASEGPFGVVFGSPKGATVDPSEITLVFNRPMHALEIAENQAAPPVIITPAVAGRWSWVGTSGLQLIPAGSEVPRATEYTVEVPAGTKALDGSTMPKPYVLRFSTVRPKLLSISASGTYGNESIEPDATFKLRFNQPVREAEVARALTIEAGEPGRPVAFDVKRPDLKNDQLLELVPRTRLPLASPVTISASPDLRGVEGPLPANEPKSESFSTYGVLQFKRITCGQDTPHKRCASDDGFSIELTNPVKFKEIKRALKIEPAVKISWPKWLDDEDVTQNVQVWGRFVPGRTYHARIAAGAIKDIHQQALVREMNETVAFDDYWPSAEIGVRGSLFDAASRRPIPVASVNVKSIELTTAPLDEAAILAMDDYAAQRFGNLKSLKGAKSSTIHPASANNSPAVHLVDPADVLGGKDKRGPMVIGISYTSKPGTMAARAAESTSRIEITDLAISAKVSPRGSLVWITRLSTGAPVRGATVSVARPGGPHLVDVTTDADGFAPIPESAFVPSAGTEKAVIFARLGDDWTFHRVTSVVESYRFGVWADLSPDHPFGMIFSDRGIYRPGDTVRLKGIFREEARSGTATPAGRMVNVDVESSDGQPLTKQTIPLTPFGTLSLDVKIPDTGRLGSYRVQATVQGSSRGYPDVGADFEVAEYRAAEFKAAVQSDHPSYIRGDQASWTARGDYLFGAPMTGADARLDVTRSETYFTPPGLDGFTTDDSAYQSGVPDSSQRQYQVQTAKAKLDAKGAATLAAPLTMPGQRGAEMVTCEADITDLSRQMISASTSAVVHPGEFYIALDGGADLFLKPGDPAKPRVLTVDPKGAKVTGIPVTLELVQRKWTMAKQAVGGGFRTESTLVDHVVATCSVTTGADPASCSLLPPSAGYYLLHATATDRRKNPLASSVGIYVTGDIGETSWGDNDKQAVELVADRKSYEVGQIAHILVKSPFKTADALVTVERSGIYTQRRMTLSGPMPTIDVPVGDDLRPNAFVSVLLVRGRTKAAPDKTDKADVGAPAFRLGYAPIPVNPETRRLKIALRPAKTELGPGDTVDIDLDVKDRAGKPAHAEITLYAVDEGVLTLVGYKTPDPIPIFGAPRSLKVTTGESRTDLARLLNPFAALGLDKGLEGGGGGEGGVRKDFKASAYFNPSLVTDAAGHAHVSFKLPDNLTTFRIMAVAAAEDDRFGYAQDRVTVSRPLMARPAFPRFIRAGDTLDAGIVVTSKGLPKSKIDVTITADGLTVDGDVSKSIDLDANSSTEVRFALKAPRVGKARVRFKIKGGGAEDTVEITREIKAPMVLEAVALYGDTTKASGEKLGDLSAIRDDVGGLDVSLSSTALVGLNSGIEQLIQYPYGCTEQLVSRLVPLLPLRDLARDYHADLPKDLDPVITKAITDILSHQRGNGGFGFWAESAEANPWVTTYALWGLSTAKRHKVAVPERAIADATSYLRRSLPSMWKNSDLLASGPFILDVLAENGEPDPGNVTKLFDRRDELPLFARAQLLHAMVLTKSDAASIDKLTSEIEGHVRLDANTAKAVSNEGDRYAVLMDSEARTSALVLRGLIAARPSHPLGAKLAMGLLAVRRGGAWRNTQETAWSLLALDDYRNAQEKIAPEFTAHVFLGEAELYKAAFHGKSLENPKTTVPTSGLAAGSGAVLSFDVEGQGRLFYEARLRYATKALPPKGLDRGFFIKKTLRAVTTEGLDDALKIVPETGVSSFHGGDLILADVVIVTPSPREIVVLDDPLPAGFEAVDAHLATTGARYNVDSADERSGGDDDDPDQRAAGGKYGSSSFLREIRDDRVLFFVDHLSAGMFHYRYLARATTNGSFIVPPTKVEEMYTPEVFGRTGADQIKITSR